MVSRFAAIDAAIVALLSVFMSCTHATTHLQTVYDALFEHAIFGVEATQWRLLSAQSKGLHITSVTIIKSNIINRISHAANILCKNSCQL
jgi:hypothetical protein